HGGEQRGLAGAVAANHANPPPRVQGQVDTGKQQPLAAAQGEIAKRDHWARILPACACPHAVQPPRWFYLQPLPPAQRRAKHEVAGGSTAARAATFPSERESSACSRFRSSPP